MAQKHSGYKIAVIGLGYVGLPLALLAAKKGHQVTGIDIDTSKVTLIQNRRSPFKCAYTAKALKKITLTASTDFSLVSTVDVVVVCVPTPVFGNKRPNYGPLRQASQAISPYLKKDHLVIIESTVNPGVCEEVVLPNLLSRSQLDSSQFYLAHCPERVNPGDKKWTVRNIPRVVGGLNKKSLHQAVRFYHSVIDSHITSMASLKEAEAVKIVENSFRNINIAFVNELAMSFSKLGIDVVNVIHGAATKPFSFMSHFPGCGIGGHCIPVDPYYLIDYAKKKNGFDHKFLTLACQTNDNMPHYTVQLIEEGLSAVGKSLNNSVVSVLGLAYKADSDDFRESPSYSLIRELKNRGAQVVTFDPYVLKERTAATLETALDHVDAVVVATGHKDFRILKPDIFESHSVRVVIDGRNCLNKKLFSKSKIYYKGIGR